MTKLNSLGSCDTFLVFHIISEYGVCCLRTDNKHNTTNKSHKLVHNNLSIV